MITKQVNKLKKFLIRKKTTKEFIASVESQSANLAIEKMAKERAYTTKLKITNNTIEHIIQAMKNSYEAINITDKN